MEKTLRAMIVDDEELARGFLREMLRAHPDIEVVAECPNGFEAVKAIGETPPDLLFLDVQMPKLDGFEVLELIDPGPVVIFVTAYDQYAMRAFDAHAVDYLLKPFSRERFEMALERARLRLGEQRPPARSGRGGARPRRAAAAHRGERWPARARHPHRQARLRRGAGRLCGPAQRRQELSEAATHRQPGIAARPGPLRAHSSLGYRQSGAGCAHRAVWQGEPGRHSRRRPACR